MVICDIETDNLLDKVTKVHCIVTRDPSTDVYTRYFGDVGIEHGIIALQEEDIVIGHNWLSYDQPVLKKLHGFEPKGTTIDTLVLSRLAWPDRTGGHSLASWAEYFRSRGIVDVPPKYFINDWSELPINEYVTRCEKDVEINVAVWEFLSKQIELPLGTEDIWKSLT